MTPTAHLTRLGKIVEECSFPEIEFVTGMDGLEDAPQYWLRVEAPDGFDTKTGEPMHWCGRKWRLSEHMTDGEVVFTVFKALITALEHETREMFKFKGVCVMDPHPDIHKLVEFMGDPGSVKKRGLSLIHI